MPVPPPDGLRHVAVNAHLELADARVHAGVGDDLHAAIVARHDSIRRVRLVRTLEQRPRDSRVRDVHADAVIVNDLERQRAVVACEPVFDAREFEIKNAQFVHALT